MLHGDRIKAAVDDVVAAALLAQGWAEALTAFARASGARDAVLMRNKGNRMIAAVTTEGVTEAVAQFAAGQAPPNSRYVRVKAPPTGEFRVDHDDYSQDELARDPFYQEFLRPNGVFWHANTILGPGRGEYIELSLKRRIELGPYGREDAAALNTALPELHAAARIAKSTLDAETRGMSWLLRRRGDLVIEIDANGRALPGQEPGEADPLHPLRILRDRLAALDPRAQPLLDQVVAGAVAGPARIGLVPLTGPDGRRYLLQIHPVPGLARDVFLAAQAIAVLIELGRERVESLPEASGLRLAFGLTRREADVAFLLAGGLSMPAIAQRLEIRLDTARTYLKDAFQKTGTNRQAELAALLARL